jgi:hypothetical protein
LSSYNELIRHDPEMAYRALGTQWENFKTALGITIVPVLIPFLRTLTESLNSLAGFAQRHPTLTKGLMMTFGALSLMATIGGTLMITGAALKLVGIGLGLIGTPLTALAAVPLAGIATGIGLIGAALLALAPIVYHKEIANAIDNKAPGLGDFLYRVFDPAAIGTATGRNRGARGAPPSSNNKATIQVQVNDPYRLVKLISQGASDLIGNAPLASGSNFDGKLHPDWGF